MNKGVRGVLSSFGVIAIVSLVYLALRREIGFVIIGLLSFLLLYLAVRMAGYTREDLGLAGYFNWKLHLVLPVAVMLMNILWVLPLGVGIKTLHPLIYVALLIKYLIFVALYEELVFRGLMQRGFELWKGERVAVILTAIIFGLSHITARFTFEPTFANFWRIYNPLLSGFVFSVYRWKFRRIEGLILAHGLGDAIDRMMTVKKVEWLLGTATGHVYMVLAYTVTQLASIFIYLKLAGSLKGYGGQPNKNRNLEASRL
ncbi:CPBP family intramembrane glutamic endopeptidase [Thermococcus sp. 21S7]|uniref:CPBP family intramembrane glutamic endopeptidase n=1 Tax=Thermococcus sp. 21S7 TaxID=1638221 RepID=UPI0014395E6D|nr:CPBP family intramembrane glutamic endopeptidase [Thermococcus sp. 21S7]NJE60290.1 CPBP family intramembrane metalloprotease [Thermococcus sp. 21S7]